MQLHRHLLALAFLLPLSGQAAPLYTASFVLDTNIFTPSDMNNAGQIVGTDGGSSLRAVFFNGTRQDIGIADAESSLGYGINNAGAITGVYLSRTDSDSHAFVYQNGNVRDLGAGTTGFGINAAGDVAGSARTVDGNTGFIDKNGVMTNIGNLGTGRFGRALAVNDVGQVVGDSTVTATDDALRHPFLYSNGTLLDLGTLGQGTDNSATAINNAGQIAGYSDAPDGTMHAFLYDGGVMQDVGGFGTSQMVINSRNEHGRFVGTAVTGASGDTPFMLLGNKLVDLNTLIDPALGWELYAAYANNDLDQIVAGGCHDHVCGLVRLDLIGAVPEPQAAWLLAPGLLVLALARRRPLRSDVFATAG